LQELFNGATSIIIWGIIESDNMNLLEAFIQLKKQNQESFDLLAVDSHDNNALHTCILRNNFKFTQYFIEHYPHMLWQENRAEQMPLILILNSAPIEIIGLCLQKIHNDHDKLTELLNTRNVAEILQANPTLSSQSRLFIERQLQDSAINSPKRPKLLL
jgi:hypothetical protein